MTLQFASLGPVYSFEGEFQMRSSVDESEVIKIMQGNVHAIN